MTARPPVTSRTLAYVRRRAEAAMTGTVKVLSLIAPTYDDNTLIMTTGVATQIYQGVARIRTELAGGAIVAGDSVIQTSATTVSLPYDAAVPKIDDIVVVLSFGADTELEDDVFQIKDVGGGGLIRATRQLQVVAYRANRWWEA